MKNTVIKHRGTVDHVSVKRAYVAIQEEGFEDLVVEYSDLGRAIHGDEVEVEVLPKRRKKDRPRGRVVKVLSRANEEVIGALVMSKGKLQCMPDHRRLYLTLVPKTCLNGAVEGDKIIVKLTGWNETTRQCVGEVVEVLGAVGHVDTEEKALMKQFGLKAAFAPELEAEVAKIPDTLPEEEIARRRDFSDVTTFTIDPDDAKDFDDALSIRKFDDGDYEIGVHIADVSHYVRPGSPLDEEASRLATSVYLVGKVSPMLPERLSNNLCSLRPKVKRPAFSMVVRMDTEGAVKGIWIGETVIFSNHRFTYEQALATLEQGSGPYAEELAVLHDIAQRLRRKRIASGAIAFETNDVKIILNDQREPVDVKVKEGSFAHQLIEEFMLLANRLVAEKITHTYAKKGSPHPFIYRVHGKPKADKIEHLAEFSKQLGYTFNRRTDRLSDALNGILEHSKGTVHQQVIQTLAIRSMAQALYSTDASVGHFGLGFSLYTHFTSPIRRYPDVLVHRLVKAYLAGQPVDVTSTYDKLVRHCSQRERLAVEAERASTNYHQVLFLKDKVGQRFKGTISGITERGIYVELVENKCDGMVRISDMSDDYYVFVASACTLRGTRRKKSYQLGQPVEVEIKRCNLQQKTIDLILCS